MCDSDQRRSIVPNRPVRLWPRPGRSQRRDPGHRTAAAARWRARRRPRHPSSPMRARPPCPGGRPRAAHPLRRQPDPHRGQARLSPGGTDRRRRRGLGLRTDGTDATFERFLTGFWTRRLGMIAGSGARARLRTPHPRAPEGPGGPLEHAGKDRSGPGRSGPRLSPAAGVPARRAGIWNQPVRKQRRCSPKRGNHKPSSHAPCANRPKRAQYRSRAAKRLPPQERLPGRRVARGRSSMAERQLPKLHTRVRFPSPAPVLR